jgi:thiamine biosynthesis lipoprotein
MMPLLESLPVGADTAQWPLWSTTARIVVTDPRALPAARRRAEDRTRQVEAACSRFRPDSELSRLHAARGAAVSVGPLLAEAVSVALRAAELTDGVVDPTVGAAVRALGYDREFVRDDDEPIVPAGPAPGWSRLGWKAERRSLVVPLGIWLDLGATAKALAADRIAVRGAAAAGCGVLVGIGGNVAVGGDAPGAGWQVRTPDDPPAVTGTLAGGGLATSSTARRRWRRGGRTVHHIVDPRSGDIATPYWRTASVVADSCVDANTASTAAIVLGRAAPQWLTERALPARLVAEDGTVTHVAGWLVGP